ncbi:hypothetical protein DEF23_24000 [Marinitenerispora sediminis]|nr:hypothetical protein DEF28_24165 [Marinitenerispora sediminis]RCV49169.1 hypothetical protein DEF23_24000 [Marinitenerispora sediminis]
MDHEQEPARGVAARGAGHLRADLPGEECARPLLDGLLPLDAERAMRADAGWTCLVRARVDVSLDGLRAASWAGERHIRRPAVAHGRGERPPGRVGADSPTPGATRSSSGCTSWSACGRGDTAGRYGVVTVRREYGRRPVLSGRYRPRIRALSGGGPALPPGSRRI